MTKKALLSVFFLLAFAACFAGFASASIGIGLSDPKYELQMVKASTYYFSFTANNTGDSAGTYVVDVLANGGEFADFFDVNYSTDEFTLEPNATKLFWVSLRPRLDSGSIEVIVELSRRPDSVSEGASTIGLHARSSIKASLVPQGPPSSFETIPPWYSGIFPPAEAPIQNPEALKVLLGQSRNPPGTTVVFERALVQELGADEFSRILQTYGASEKGFIGSAGSFEVSKKFTVLKTIDSSLALSFSTFVEVTVTNKSGETVNNVTALESIPQTTILDPAKLSSDNSFKILKGNIVEFSLGSLDAGESVSYSYSLNSLLEEDKLAQLTTAAVYKPSQPQTPAEGPGVQEQPPFSSSIADFAIVCVAIAVIILFLAFLYLKNKKKNSPHHYKPYRNRKASRPHKSSKKPHKTRR